MIDSLKDLLGYLYNVKGLIEWGGPAMVCAIIFAETGLFLGFFLPGDSLLVIAGVFAAVGKLSLIWLLVPVTLCAILGDQLGYWIGRKAGQTLYERKDSRFFKKSHLLRAHEFYEKYGVKTIILARFVTIVRTFCPPVTGAARMSYPRYLVYDIIGGILWVWSMTLIGYSLGVANPHIDRQIHWVIAAVIFVSLLPAIISVLRSRLKRARVAPPSAQVEKE